MVILKHAGLVALGAVALALSPLLAVLAAFWVLGGSVVGLIEFIRERS